MEIREAKPADAIHVGRVHQRAIAELGPRAYSDEQVSAWRGDRDPADYELETNSGYHIVAERNDTIIGFGHIAPEQLSEFEHPIDAEIGSLYVHPDHARSGVGSALLGDLESKACEWNASAVGLYASLNSVEFYERQGYERIREREHEFRGDATGTVVEMRRELE